MNNNISLHQLLVTHILECMLALKEYDENEFNKLIEFIVINSIED